jgi:hypothetical protein
MLRPALVPAITAAVLALTAADASGPRCLGAASRAGCRNAALDRRVSPTPAQAMRMPNAPCEPVAVGVPFVCVFGAERDVAVRDIALIGDSHAVHWRAALGPVARLRGWRGSSLTRAGCPYSTATPILPPRLLPDCLRWRRTIPAWLRDHPEVDTVFVSQHHVRVRGGRAAQLRGYEAAWRALPRTVAHIVVIRDTPAGGPAVRACVNRSIRRGRPAGLDCAVPRRLALHTDPAAAAARRTGQRRVALVDMTRWFCDARLCYPVVGGVLVHKDNTHITAAYGATLAPYLARKLEALGI